MGDKGDRKMQEAGRYRRQRDRRGRITGNREMIYIQGIGRYRRR
jgi:hypothetical protein